MIAARDSDGQLFWFYAGCSLNWDASFLNDGPLFYKDGIWVLMPGPIEALTEPEGILVEPETALSWFIRNQYEPPVELSDLANERQI